MPTRQVKGDDIMTNENMKSRSARWREFPHARVYGADFYAMNAGAGATTPIFEVYGLDKKTFDLVEGAGYFGDDMNEAIAAASDLDEGGALVFFHWKNVSDEDVKDAEGDRGELMTAYDASGEVHSFELLKATCGAEEDIYDLFEEAAEEAARTVLKGASCDIFKAVKKVGAWEMATAALMEFKEHWWNIDGWDEDTLRFMASETDAETCPTLANAVEMTATRALARLFKEYE